MIKLSKIKHVNIINLCAQDIGLVFKNNCNFNFHSTI